MTGIAVVASAQDARFAEEVRAGLRGTGLESAISPSLPQAAETYVILIWSAELEAAHSIDAQALIGLWSEERLLVARRDATLLPLGLRDLPSLSPTSTAAEVCASFPRARYAIASPPVDRESQISVGSMADFAATPKADATIGTGSPDKREAQLKTELWDAPKAKMPIGVVAGVIIAIAGAGGGAWYYFNKGNLEKQAALTAALDGATKATEDLKQAHLAELEALKALDRARAAEVAAHKSGDIAKLKEAQEAAQRAEAEANKQVDLVKQREAAAADARKKAQDGAESAKKAAQKAEVPTAAPAMESPKPEAPKAEVPRAEQPTAKAPAQPEAGLMRPKSRSERERIADDEAARAAATTRGAEHLRGAPVSPSAPTSAGAEPTSAPDHDALYQQAVVMEKEGRGIESIRIYRRAARAGSGKAALRLGEIYDRGVPGVSRDYAESLQWYETARRLGEQVEPARARGESEGPVVAPVPAPERKPVAPESVAVGRAAPIPVPPESVIPEAEKSKPAKTAVKSAPATQEPPKPVPVPPPAPAVLPEPPKVATPAPAPAPAKAATEPSAPVPESKSGWFSSRGLLIALFVLALIAWRRSRRGKKAEARRAQRESGVATSVPVLHGKAAARSVYKPSTAAPQGDATLFVSYSHKDRSRVEPIVSVIEAMGRRVWMDRSDITGQTGWAGQIVRAIRECRAVVLMASPNSYTSDQVVRELYLAMNHKKTIVPIEIEPAEMPDELQYILAPFQHHRLSGHETREVIGRALAAV